MSFLRGLWYIVLTVPLSSFPYFLAENCDSHEVSAHGRCRFRARGVCDDGSAGG
jgi:hypothetical protein